MKKIDEEWIFKYAMEMQKEYDDNFDEKGDSWKRMTINQLSDVLENEIEELRNSSDTVDGVIEETVDVGLLCAMIWNRVKELKEVERDE